MPSQQHTYRELPGRILRVLAEARSAFGSDKAQREPLRRWYEERYGSKYLPGEIVKNGYLQIRGQRGWYWLDPEKMNDDASLDDQIVDETAAAEDSSLSDFPEAAVEAAFELEHQLRDFIAHNIGSIPVDGKRLRLYVDPDGRDGVEYPSAVGPIDILAIDDSGAFVVFELKRGHSPDRTIGQLSRYMGWVKHTLAGNGRRDVHGVIIARSIPDNLRYGASVVPNVSLFEYQVAFTLNQAHGLPAI